MGNVRFTGRMWRRQLKIDSLRQRSAFSAIGIVIYETMYWPEQLQGRKEKGEEENEAQKGTGSDCSCSSDDVDQIFSKCGGKGAEFWLCHVYRRHGKQCTG